jgi:F-type H+-transporting ATPase subunit a
MAAEQEIIHEVANGSAHVVADAAHAAAEHVAEAHAPELPNIIHLLHVAFGGNSVIDFIYAWNYQIYTLIVLCVIFWIFTKKIKGFTLVPGRLQAFLEIIVTALFDIVAGILGEKEARRYFPLLGSLFTFILMMNWMGLVPLMRAPTSSICVTFGLALCVFVVVQVTAFTRLGPLNYLYHLCNEPKDAIGWCLVPLFLPLHIMDEFIKPVSLSARLFGNILGEDILLGVMLMLGLLLSAGILGVVGLGGFAIVGVPFHLPFMFVSMLLGAVQALVFTMLSTLYISSTIPHGDHH